MPLASLRPARVVSGATMRTKLVAIVGGTASGKSTLADRLVQIAGPGVALRLPLDSYYRCSGHLTPEERDRQNMDHPDTLDQDLYAAHLKALVRGEEIEVPVYDFKTHTRSTRVERIYSAPIVIAEGILVLHYPEVRALCDYSIFLDVSEQERLSRRIARDVRERGRTERSVLEQWTTNVQPMHATFCEPSKVYASEVVCGAIDESAVSTLWARVTKALE